MDIQQTVDFFKPAYKSISNDLASYLADAELAQLRENEQELTSKGIPADIARYLTQLSTVFSVMDIAQVSDNQGSSLAMVAEL